MARYRAWRFASQPGEPVPGEGGIGLTSANSIAMVDGSASIRQAILLLLSTEPGERVMRPDYGCSLRHLVFATNDENTAGLAIHYVRQAILRWEPRVEKLRVVARRHVEEPGRLDLLIQYRERATQRPDEILYPFYLEGEPL